MKILVKPKTRQDRKRLVLGADCSRSQKEKNKGAGLRHSVRNIPYLFADSVILITCPALYHNCQGENFLREEFLLVCLVS